MSADRRLEQELPRLLDDLYVGPMPAYRDYVLEQTARTRQRPAWSFVGGWIPMVDIARQPVPAPRLPWRAIGLGLALLALLLGLIAALAVGARPHLPAPFGLARSGLVTYASGGDIYTVDPVTGRSTAITSGPETDLNPRWSRDGTRVVFEREAYFGAGSDYLYVARSDGSHLTRVTPQPLPITSYDFSPDGKELLISVNPAGNTGLPGLVIAATDGSGMHQLDVGMPATNAAWRPPDGSEIMFMDRGNDSDGFGAIHLVSAQGGPVHTILKDDGAAGRYRGHPEWSPDGSMISFGEWTDRNSVDVQTHIIRADGSGDRVLPLPPGAVWQAPYGWSNDGTRLLVIRGYTGGGDKARPAAIPVDGSGFGTEIPYPGGMDVGSTSTWEWAPDDSTILGTPWNTSGDLLGQLLLDPVHGTSRLVPWSSDSQPSWQRLAP